MRQVAMLVSLVSAAVHGSAVAGPQTRFFLPDGTPDHAAMAALIRDGLWSPPGQVPAIDSMAQVDWALSLMLASAADSAIAAETMLDEGDERLAEGIESRLIRPLPEFTRVTLLVDNGCGGSVEVPFFDRRGPEIPRHIAPYEVSEVEMGEGESSDPYVFFRAGSPYAGARGFTGPWPAFVVVPTFVDDGLGGRALGGFEALDMRPVHEILARRL